MPKTKDKENNEVLAERTGKLVNRRQTKTLPKETCEEADNNLHRQPGCDYRSSSKQDKIFARRRLNLQTG